MRWKEQINVIGERRVIKRFLLFPRKIQREWRWLETAYIIQIMTHFGWRDSEWVESEKR